MAVAQLPDAGLWIWSPIALTERLVREVEALGTVKHIVSPNRLHHRFLRQWSLRWPNALLHAPPGLACRRPDLNFDFDPPIHENGPSLTDIIDQVVFPGSSAMEEVVFFHRASRTAIFGDLIQRLPPSAAKGWKGLRMRFAGLVGEHGSTPPDWRASFLHRKRARIARNAVLAWNPERLLIAHGQCVQTGAAAVIAAALAWI
jgi:hypothetical protein